MAGRRPNVNAPNAAPGTTVDPRRLTLDGLRPLLVNGLVVAAGLDPVQVSGTGQADQVPSVLWDNGSDRLLVHLAGVKVALGDGFVEVFLVVECDQTRQSAIAVTLVTTSMRRPAGFLLASEDRPRGPAVIVDTWGEALLALAWRALVEVARVVAASAGRDQFDRPFVASTVVATPEALVITPMVPHLLSDGPEPRT